MPVLSFRRLGKLKLEHRSFLAQNIVHRRGTKKWTQITLAEKTGFHVNHIKDIELDKSEPSIHAIRTIADTFGCTVADLFSGPNEARSSKAALIIKIVERLPALSEGQLKRVLSSMKSSAQSE